MNTSHSASIRPALLLRAILPLLGLAATLAQAQTVPLAKQRLETIGGKQYMLTSKLKKILMGDFYYNFNHSTATTNLDSTLRRIGRDEGWTVDIVSGTGASGAQSVTAAKLADYQVFFANFISSWASNTGFPSGNRTAIQNFVETQGGGVFVMHSSGDSRSSSNWAWYYSTLMPITYTGESNRTDVSAKVGINPPAKSHPVMEGIAFSGANGPDSNVWPQGEWHTFSSKITTKVPESNIFMKMNPGTCFRSGTNSYNCGIATSTFNYGTAAEGYPATWTFPAGKGNVGYFMEGHDLVTMNAMGQAVWDRFFKQFMYYIAGYDTVEVTAIGRPGGKGFPLDRSGISFQPNEPGVFITAPGRHVVSLYDLSGRQLRQVAGRKTPARYNFADLVPRSGKIKGIYVMRVSVGKKAVSRSYVY
jgi:hypothetical protein